MAPVADDAERAEDYQPYIPSAPSSNPYGAYDYGLSNILSYPSYDNTGYGSSVGSSGSYDAFQNFGEVASYGYIEGQRAVAPDAYAMWQADYGRHWDGKKHTTNSAAAPDMGHVHNNMENYLGGAASDSGMIADFDQDDHAYYQGTWASATHNSIAGNDDYDKSWELGLHPSDVRALDDTSDGARMKCRVCKIDFQVAWVKDTGFVLKKKGGAAFYADEATAIAACDADQDEDGDNISTFCPYSSGVCFVEERRQFGFLISYERGCKQAKACYMQKYQNFLVKAGRQCWPVDATSMADKIARRPYDIQADEWYMTKNINSHDDTFTDFTDVASSTADTGGLIEGLYIDPDYVLDNSAVGVLNYNSLHVVHGHSGAYANGMKETSRCTQCCANADDCNASWIPETEAEWAADHSTASTGRK